MSTHTTHTELNLAERRKDLVATSMDNIKSIIRNKGVNPEALNEVETILGSMSQEKEMFSDAEFPTPTPEEIAKIYLLTDDNGGDFSLYLVSIQPTGPSPVHDHGTFAVIAGLQGEEENTIYKRMDDKSEPGKAAIEEDFKVVLGDGDTISFMPEDIHRIQVCSETPTRHFHLYGKGFEQQTERLVYSLENGTTKAASGSFRSIDESRRIV
ncbi:MAG: cysteine dioxygenase family protein [Pseudomonadales bacterium]